MNQSKDLMQSVESDDYFDRRHTCCCIGQSQDRKGMKEESKLSQLLIGIQQDFVRFDSRLRWHIFVPLVGLESDGNRKF